LRRLSITSASVPSRSNEAGSGWRINPTTFSWEPYLERSIGHGTDFSWLIDYEF